MLKRIDSDNFYAMNSDLCTFMGSIIMWFSLCHIMSGLNLSIFGDRYDAELGYINCLVAGGAGGLSACIVKNLIDMPYEAKAKKGGTKFNCKGRYDYST